MEEPYRYVHFNRTRGAQMIYPGSCKIDSTSKQGSTCKDAAGSAFHPVAFDNSQRLTLIHQRYSRELKVWVGLMHENILPLLGVAAGHYASHGCAALVCPWMENGTLDKYLTAYPKMALRRKLQLVCSTDKIIATKIPVLNELQLRDVAAGLRYRAL